MTPTIDRLRLAARRTRTRLLHYRNDEDGGMIIFSVILFVLILSFGGMAVDFMRYETTRAQLQGTLDRATLAAADLDQTMPPADVVRDYFTKAGMIQFLDGDPVVEQGINYRRVTANAKLEMPLFFFDLPRIFTQPFTPGLSSLTVSGSSSAEERVTDVEVSLVLDVSSSMESNNRIGNLRNAAREFVTTVLENNTNAPQGLITISMIPYSAVVNPGTTISPYLNINRTHSLSTCPLFDDEVFETTVLDLGTAYDHVSHFEYNSSNGSPRPINNPWCFTDDHNAIVPVTSNESVLHTAIDDLAPYGNTAIDMGMKWGVGLLDPSTRTMITGLANSGGNTVPSMASGRPEAFGLPDVLKVIVLMTDGQNTQQWDLIEPYKSGRSNVWFNRNSTGEALQNVSMNRTSVLYDGDQTPTNYRDDMFFWNDRSRVSSYPYGFNDRNHYENVMLGNDTNPTVVNATWQDLFAIQHHGVINDTWLQQAYNARFSNGNSVLQWWRGSHLLANYASTDYALNQSVVDNNRADDRLEDICEAARDEGMIIYAVAFEAPSAGQRALLNCASSPSHYFDVSGTDISAAFSAIASDIRALKLTQ